MNREIKFRGKRIDDGEWCYGSLVLVEDPTKEETVYISAWIHGGVNRSPMIKVELESVGQFTGLKNYNGDEVYEGDILRYPPKDSWENENYSCFEVFFHDGNANFDYNIGFSLNRAYHHGSICGGYIPPFKPKQVSEMIPIGTVYQNPELISK